LNRHLGPHWLDDPSDRALWDRVDGIPARELWELRCRRRMKLVEWVRKRLPQQFERRGTDATELAWTRRVLDPDVLTVGWARRFTTYKRALLLFRDPNRLHRLLTDAERPIQIVLAGKAHPNDHEGRRLIREVASFAAHPHLRHKVVLLANYDIGIARMLVRGVDLWLNTPRRPLEASGTSGMKVVPNGGLNLSTLDGWWAEAFDADVGWALGGPESPDDPDLQDEADSRRLYDLLETEIVPLFYRRGADGLPEGWISKMRASIRRLSPVYNTNRMVAEYLDRFYLPALRREEVGAPAGSVADDSRGAPAGQT
jgi:starch phosphorylase